MARQRSLHECRSPSVKTFWRSAVVRQLLAEHHLLLQPIFLTQRPQCFTQQRHRLESSYFLLKLFNISIPVAKELLKHTSARTVHAKVIVKPARVVKFEFLSERFGEKLTGDPNALTGVLGPPIPPSTRVKNLRIVCKKRALYDDSLRF